ncbi:hypothetical protein D9Q98_008290 [Chlorella vulgaris]|uniref:Serine aminopeptidase S33 domain-containing protein n=1 Tax=Chlorella vulgaris TaxID=3077 RepID=A0A9D4TGF3_CHLVU|nr:hypothetical protein D9Q98_008290 [Chlorella vulgaris]
MHLARQPLRLTPALTQLALTRFVLPRQASGRPASRCTTPCLASVTMVQYFEGERASSKGHKLLSVTYLPEAAAGPPSAVLLFHHGISEHIGRYKSIFERFAEAGIAVYSGDIVGHGRSEGHRALVENINDTADEMLALAQFAKEDVQKRFPGAPLPPMFIGGHSLGGLIAAMACQRDQSRWSGLLLSSPALDVEMGPVLRIQAALGGLLAAVVPKARIVPAVDPTDMIPDASLVEMYSADPLNTVGNLPARTGNEILKGMRGLRPHWPSFKLPLYIHHGDSDKCTSAPASQAFFAAAASPDKKLELVEGGYHELMFTPGVSDVLVSGMIEWITQRAAVGATAVGSGAAKM